MCAEFNTVVIDNGTGFTKMGYAGNFEPSYIIPSVIADSAEKVLYIYINTHIYIYKHIYIYINTYIANSINI